MKKILLLFIFLPLFGLAQTDTTSLSNRINNCYSSVTKLNDTTFTLNRPNGSKDTIVISFPYYGSGESGTTSYSNSGGSGDRSSTVTVSDGSSGIIYWNGATSQAVNGNTTENNWYFCNACAVSGLYVRFDFGSSKTIDEAKFYQSTSDSHGTWKWQGSSDASSWTDIGSSFTLGGVQTQTITSLSGNTTAYRYYRIIGVSGNTTYAPYLREFEFKIK